MLKTIHHFSQNSFVEKVKKSKEEENSEVNLGQQMPKCRLYGSRCYVRLEFVRQFKSELARQLEGVVFEKKKVHNLT